MMKEKLTKLATIGLMSLLVSLSSAIAQDYAVPLLTSTPTIDGDASDAVWAAVVAEPIAVVRSGKSAPDGDVAEFKAGWKNDTLYLMVKIQDESYVWNDYLGVYLDLNNQKTGTYVDNSQFYWEQSFQGWFELSRFGPDWEVIEESELERAISATDGLTVFEFAIPAGVWGRTGSSPNIGFELKITDNDLDVTQDVQYLWHQNGGDIWNNPSLFGTLALPIITWTGDVDSDWLNTGNWDGAVIPSHLDNVVIANSGISPVITAGVEVAVNDLKIEETASLEIQSGGSLAIFGDATNNGNYTVKKAIKGGLGTPNTAGYSILGAPVSDAMVGDLSLADFIYGFDNVTDAWEMPAGDMVEGVGYFVGYDEINPTVSFTGTPNAGEINYSYTETNGHELVANPYAAAIDVTKFILDNSTISTTYLWDDGGANVGSNRGGDYIALTGLGAASSVEPNGVSDGVIGLKGSTAANDGFIASIQGFFVDVSGSGTITFKPSQQSTEDASNDETDHYRVVKNKKIKLAISGNGLYNEVLVGLLNEATNGVDRGLDGKKFISDNPLSFFTLIDGEKYVIQAVPNDVEKVLLGFDLAKLGDYTISVVSFENFGDSRITLRDNLKDIEHELNEESVIPFSLSTSTKNDLRFELIFNSRRSLSVDSFVLKNLELSGTSNELKLRYSGGAKEQVIIHTIGGQIVYNSVIDFDGDEAIIHPSLKTNQVYIIKIGKKMKKFLLSK